MTPDSTLKPSQPVPPNVMQLAATAQLGAFDRVYVPKRQNWAVVVATIVIGLLTVVILVGFLILWLVARMPNLSSSQAARRIYLYDRGFIIADRPDDPQVYRWDQIDTVFQKIVSRRTYGIETNRTYLYTITRRDGPVLKLTQFWDGIAELGPRINASVSAALLRTLCTAQDAMNSLKSRSSSIRPSVILAAQFL